MIVTVPDTITCMETFDRIDFNHAGVLSITELEQAVKEVWPGVEFKSATVVRAYKACDVNSDGFIGRNEFELFLTFLAFYNNLWVQQHSSKTKSNAALVLTKEEFTSAALRLNIANVEETFRDIDTNDNGHVKYEDFISYMARHTLGRKTSKGGSFRFANAGSTQALEATRRNQQKDNAGGVTYLARLMLDLHCSIDFLHGACTEEDTEAWAILIHDVMSNTQHRALHGMDYMFEIWHGADPVQTLAICFTHVVFHVSDGEQLHPKVQELLQGVMTEANGFVISQQQDKHVSMVMSIFGVTPGETLDPYLLDKFLSAIVAVRLLKDSLPMVQLAKVVVCIEATITYLVEGGSPNDSSLLFSEMSPPPKHDDSSSRKTAFYRRETSILEEKALWLLDRIHAEALKPRRTLDNLFERLLKTNGTFDLGLTQHKAIKAVQRAADVANRFRGSVFVTDMESHLTKLWSLLPEFNPALRQPKLYTVRDYHIAVKNLERLVCFVSEHQVFVSFRGVPDDREVASFTRTFQQNVEMGKKYVRTKLVSIAIVAAFSVLTGGDHVPVCFITGDPISQDNQERSYQLGDGLPKLNPEQLKCCDEEMYRVLSNRAATPNSLFDITNWAKTAFVYGMLGDDGIVSVLKYTSYPMGSSQARALLSKLPLNVVVPLGEEIAKIAVSRTDAVMQLLNELKQ